MDNTNIQIGEELDTLSISSSNICAPEQCKQQLLTSVNQLTLLCQNIRSINCNMPAFEVLLKRTNLDCDIYILTETWNQGTYFYPSISNYKTYFTKVNLNQNDGVVLFMKENLDHDIYEANLCNASCLVLTLNNNTVIIGIYRSPSVSDLTRFLTSLDTLLNKYSSYSTIIITGDLNIDISNENSDTKSPDYLNLLAFHGILPGHILPTREKKCIDHIMIKATRQSKVLVLEAPLTDHSAVILSLPLEDLHNKLYSPKIVKRTNYEQTIIDIESADFSTILRCNDPNIATDILLSSIKIIIDKNTNSYKAPRRKRNLKTWITPGLMRCMYKRDQLHLHHRQDPDNTSVKLKYIEYRNTCNDILKRLKRAHDRNRLNSTLNNPKKRWKTIRSITYSEPSKEKPNDLLKIASTPTDAVNLVNNYFANVGKNLANKILNSNIHSPHTNCSSDNSPVNSMGLLPCTETEVSNIIAGLKTDCAVGWDGVSTKILKLAKHILIPIITHICNLSLTTGIFPTSLKKALIHPIHKSGPKDQFSNYRPISVLPALSKILEKIINSRLLSFLKSENILSENQYGFRVGKSTSDAVSKLTNHVARQLDKSNKCIGIFLDLAKAFDTVSITDLLSRLEKLGVRGLTLDLFTSYLSDRTQRVNIGDYQSTDEIVTFGVPQGSVLGPSLFLIYINELCNMSLRQGMVFTFADDTALIFHGVDWKETQYMAEIGLNQVMTWLNNNLLTLNVTKTKYIAFSITNTSLPCKNFSIKVHNSDCNKGNGGNCKCTSLERTSSIKYLGVTIDELLNWKEHIELLAARVRRLIYIFKKLRHVTDTTTLKNIYFALAQSIMTYCIIAWGGACKSHMLQLERAQRALLKVMFFKPYRFPTTTLYNEYGVLSIRKLYLLQTIVKQHKSLMYDCDNDHPRKRNKIFHTVWSRTYFANRFEYQIGPRFYNKMNALINIYPLNNTKCKKQIVQWLKTKSYQDCENFFYLAARW